MSTPRSQYTLMLFHETPKAMLFGTDPEHRETDEAFWLPSAHIDCFPLKGGWFNVDIPDWLAEERGLCPHVDGEVIEDDVADAFEEASRRRR